MSTTGSSSLGPLSVGNVVSAGVRIYRSHLQQYYKLALLAYVWLFVPIYGWAKYFAISAQISRLAFQELINQPESNEQSRSHTNRRMWSFLGTAILVGLILVLAYFAIAFVVGLLIGALTILATNLGIPLLGVVLSIVPIAAGIIFFIRLYSRFIVTEVALGIEPGLGATSTISRSFQLTDGFAGRIQWVLVIAFLITLLINVPLQLANLAVQGAALANPESPLVGVFSLVLLVVGILCGALLLPFWQVIKAVIYYDLRSRREGLGLELRDRKR